MIQEIKYNGFSAVPSDYECQDGDLAISLDMIPEDGALKPIMPPKVIKTLSAGQSVIFIHTTAQYYHFIVYKSSTGEFSYIDKEMDDSAAIGTVQNVTHVNAIGNTLMVFTDDAINYFLWKNGEYISLGDHVPEIDISFGLIGHARFSSISDEPSGAFEIGDVDEDKMLDELPDEQKTSITNTVLAKVNKFIANETTNKGRFCFPFFVRYATRLYDGSLIHHSAPVLMNPATKNAPIVYTEKKDGRWLGDVFLMACDLDYRVVKTSDTAMLEDWADIIKNIEIYISKPIYTFDQSGTIEKFSGSGSMNDEFIGKLYAKGTIDELLSFGREDYLMGNFSSLDFLDEYTEWAYPYITRMYKYWTLPQYTVELPQFTDDKMEESVSNTSTFYKLCSLEIDEAISDNTRKKIDIADDYLQSLLTREVMTDDYLTNDRLQADYSFVYNNRINLAGVKRSPFKGFLAQSMFSFTSISYFIWAADSSTITITPNKSSNTKCSVKVYIKEDGEDYIVDRSVESIDEYKIGTFTSYMTDNKRSWATYLFYPNVNAYKMIIYDSDTNAYSVDLKPHDFLNGAYAKLDYELVRTKNFTSLPDVTPKSDGLIDMPNKIYTSEINNPFYFPLTGINTVGTGEIMGICAATKALSQGQFGQFPLYAFSTDGVWALEVSDSGTYTAKQPVTRDVCINPECITQIDNAVLFVTDRGIMLISGSETICLSDILNSEDVFGLTQLPKYDKLVSVFNDVASETEQIAANDATFLPFKEFVAGCRMIYDYVHQRIIVYNSTVSYAYVYSLKSKMWGMMSSDIVSNINSYPEALAMAEGSKLINLSETDETQVTSLVVTRPFKIGEANVFKTINAIIQRGFFDRSHVRQILYGSNDLFNWHIVWSSEDKYLRGFRGTPYKAYRLALICSLDKAESLYGFTVQYITRMTNQPR